MPKLLRNIRLDEISLVDNPANQHATVTLFKRDDPAGRPGNHSEGVTMTNEELQKKADDLESQVESLTKRAEDAEVKAKSADALEEAVKAAGLEVHKSDDGSVKVTKADDEFVMIDGEKVRKSEVPSGVLKRLEKLESDAESDRLAKRAETELPNLAGDASDKGALLKAIDGIQDEDTRKRVTESITAADKAVSTMFKELGGAGGDNDAAAQLNKRCNELAKEKGTTFEKAYADFVCTTEGGELLRKSREEAN